MVEQLPFGMRAAGGGDVPPVRTTGAGGRPRPVALCGALGDLVLDGGRLDQAVQCAGGRVRETHLGTNIAEVLRLVPDVAFPSADCSDVAEWVGQYNAAPVSYP
ncbi:hypothetical protein ACWGQT_00745 [Streptomyces yangpuensis]